VSRRRGRGRRGAGLSVPGMVPGMVLGTALGMALATTLGAGLVALPAAAAQPDAPPAAATLTVELAPREITVGDRVEAVLTLRGAAATLPAFPVWEEHWGDAEILAAAPPVDEGGGVWRQRLALTVFVTGLATLPAVDVSLPAAAATATSEPQVITVRSVLPADDAEAAPQAPEPVRALPAGGLFWWSAGLLGLGCAALAAFVLRRARAVQGAVAALALGPFEALEAALARLRRENEVERLVTGMSLELRRYLGRAIGFRAAEATTTEVQRGLRDKSLPADLVRDTLGLLREADRVKFARGRADRDWAGRRLEDVAALARRVEEWLEPESGVEAAP